MTPRKTRVSTIKKEFAVPVAVPVEKICRRCQAWRRSNRLTGPAWVGACVKWTKTTKETDTCDKFKAVTSEQ
jgi:hypothetical protein